MALPVSPAPRSDDIAVLGWHGITVRVAWTLLAQGVKVRPQVLRDAREHALYHLDKTVPLSIAEDLATQLTGQFVQRARGRWQSDPWGQDATMPLSPRWRRAIDRSLDPAGELVFRKHFADGRGLDWLESRHGVERLVLESARSGLREVIRRQAQLDGVPIGEWPADRIDRLLGRLAAWSPGPCPPVFEILEGAHREHVVGCTRCDRTLRLVRGEVISQEDLVPPSLGARPERTTSVLAIHFHPDGRQHRVAVQKELQIPSVQFGDDLLLVDGASIDAAQKVLFLAAELGVPRRDHLRAALVEGPGHWSKHGLLGPLADRGEQEVRTRAWGSVDGLGDLPSLLPEPPSARGWWLATGLLAAAALAIARWTLLPSTPPVEAGLQVEFTDARGGIWTEFDVDDTAVVAVIRETEGRALELVVPGASPADKADVATGDGRFLLHTQGDGVLVAATSKPVPELGALLERASTSSDPLDALAAAIERASPGADVRVRVR
jgi:hypothetical protein